MTCIVWSVILNHLRLVHWLTINTDHSITCIYYVPTSTTHWPLNKLNSWYTCMLFNAINMWTFTQPMCGFFVKVYTCHFNWNTILHSILLPVYVMLHSRNTQNRAKPVNTTSNFPLQSIVHHTKQYLWQHSRKAHCFTS